MKGLLKGSEPAWSRRLEVVGSELFLRYRKRLLQTGISLEIWRAYPGLSLPDVWLRVHTARQIIREGDDFVALAAIRQGRWRQERHPSDRSPRGIPRVDRASRLLVTIGGALFALFCGLSLAAAVGAGAGVQAFNLFIALLTAAGVAAVLRRVRAVGEQRRQPLTGAAAHRDIA